MSLHVSNNDFVIFFCRVVLPEDIIHIIIVVVDVVADVVADVVVDVVVDVVLLLPLIRGDI